MDKKGIWVLQGDDMFCELFYTKETALVLLFLSHSSQTYNYSSTELRENCFGIVIEIGGVENRYVLDLQQVHEVVEHL